MRLLLDLETQDGAAPIPLDGDCHDLVAFMSFAVSRGFGATHPLIALADRLHDAHGLSLGALTTFYDAEEEDGEDREKRELTWQAAAALRAELAAVAAAIGGDPQAQALVRRADAEGLLPSLCGLITALGALPGEARVRMGYTL